MKLHLFQKVAALLAERAKRKQVTASAYRAIETGDEKTFSAAIEAEPDLLNEKKFLLALEQYGNGSIVTTFLKHVKNPNIVLTKIVGYTRIGPIYAYKSLLVCMIEARNFEGAMPIASDPRTNIKHAGQYGGYTPLEAAENRKGAPEASRKLISILREREAELHEQTARKLRGQSQNLNPNPQ